MKRRKQDRNRTVVRITLLGLLSLCGWTAGTMAGGRRHIARVVASASASVDAVSDEVEAVLSAPSVTAVQLHAAGWDLPLTRNDRVQYWVDFLSGRRRAKMQEWLEASGRYAPMIQAQLRERGMPEDLLYLAFIESGFSPNAYSKAKAVGLWQFIEETGERHGLEVSQYVDERRDPVKSTGAALDFLTSLHKQFGSWYLAAAAYNSGPNRVERLLREHENGARGDEELYWRIAPYLPQETRDYVPLMLAAGLIAKDPAKYGFTNLNYAEPLGFSSVVVPGGVSLSAVAKASAAEDSVVRALNPQLVLRKTPPGRVMQVRIPENHVSAFAQNSARVFAESAREVAVRTPARSASVTKKHVVRRGETLTAIARKYRVSLASLRAANNGVSAKSLKPGRVLKVPGNGVSRVALN